MEIDYDELRRQVTAIMERELLSMHYGERLAASVAAQLARAVVRDVLAEQKRIQNELALRMFRDQAAQAAATTERPSMVFTPTSFTCPCGHVISGQPGELNIQSHTIGSHSELWLDRAQMVSSEIAGHVLTCAPAQKVIARVRML